MFIANNALYYEDSLGELGAVPASGIPSDGIIGPVHYADQHGGKAGNPAQVTAFWNNLGSDGRQIARASYAAMVNLSPKTANSWAKRIAWWKTLSKDKRQEYRAKYVHSSGILDSVAGFASHTIPGFSIAQKAIQGKKIDWTDVVPAAGAIQDVTSGVKRIVSGKKIRFSDIEKIALPDIGTAKVGMNLIHSVPGLYSIAMMVPVLDVALPAIDLGLQALAVAEGGKFDMASLISALPMVANIPGVGAVIAAASKAGLKNIGDIIKYAKQAPGLIKGAGQLANLVSRVSKVSGAMPKGTNISDIESFAKTVKPELFAKKLAKAVGTDVAKKAFSVTAGGKVASVNNLLLSDPELNKLMVSLGVR